MASPGAGWMLLAPPTAPGPPAGAPETLPPCHAKRPGLPPGVCGEGRGGGSRWPLPSLRPVTR